jgi:hypothetical protein
MEEWMSKAKVALGIVSYGGQSAHWWKPMFDFIGTWDRSKLEYAGCYHSGVSTTDINRNNVAHEFMKGDADWLFWVDADNPPPIGAIERMMEPRHELISGLYYGGDIRKEMAPVAYVRNAKGGYHNLKQVKPFWNKGEILAVDAVGNGCFLNHRSVFEKIQDNFTVFQRQSGGKALVHKDNVRGVVPDTMVKHPYALQVKNGILYDPIIEYDMSDKHFPFYMCQYGRTEDYTFCENARELGYMIWVDTFIEIGHVKDYPFGGKEYRDQTEQVPDPRPQEVDYV